MLLCFVCPSFRLSGWFVYLVLSTVPSSVWSIFLSDLSFCTFCLSVCLYVWLSCLSVLSHYVFGLSVWSDWSVLSVCLSFLSVCMSVLSVCLSSPSGLSVLSVCLSVCQFSLFVWSVWSVSLSVCMYGLYVCMSACLCLYLSDLFFFLVCLSACLSLWSVFLSGPVCLVCLSVFLFWLVCLSDFLSVLYV